jgi:membrane-bound lytic murein transglycosylase B
MNTAVDDIPKEVKDMFLQMANYLRSQGWQRYSSDAIVHRIRWHFRVDKGERDFKCNNNWTARLARWAIATQPDLDGFFELRESPHARFAAIADSLSGGEDGVRLSTEPTQRSTW